MRVILSYIVLFLFCSNSVFAKPPKIRGLKIKQLGVTIWSELGRRALVHHARKRLTDVAYLSSEKKEEYINKSAKATVAIILYEFASGTGSTHRYFHGGQPYTEEFKIGPAMRHILQEYKDEKASMPDATLLAHYNKRYQFSATVIPFKPETWNFAVAQNVIALKEVNMSQFMLGSFNYNIIEKPNGDVEFMAWNTTSLKSLFIGIPPRVQRPLILGNVYQHIHFVIDQDEIESILSKEKVKENKFKP